ncbi:MAG: TIM barrel protein [Eubacteriales bacterium]
MHKRLFCSTGCLIGRQNNCDWRLIPHYARAIDVSGFEFMMLGEYYGHFDEIARTLSGSGLAFPVLHCDKLIGNLLCERKDEDTAEALRRFDSNCTLARKIGARRVVLHLWGGFISDSSAEYNIDKFQNIIEIAAKYGVTPLVENIPCTTRDPLCHWDEISAKYPGTQFIFDTRFGGLHRQNGRFAFGGRAVDGSVTHMHISDFLGLPLEYKAMRPILHPGEGVVDFELLFGALRGRYTGTVTLESPVLYDGGIDIAKLNRTLHYIEDKLLN